MKILVLNAGSSSQKSCLYDIGESIPTQTPVPIWEAELDWIDPESEARITSKTKDGVQQEATLSFSSRKESILYLLRLLHSGSTKVISSLDEISAVGHRVVHGGQDYQSSAIMDAEVKAAINRLSALAPDHNPANLEGIELMEQLLCDVPQVAVFDTAFHSQMPQVAATYPGPYDCLEQGIRRYGFHGISHQYCANKSAQILNRSLEELRLITCHLGNGCSLAAVKNGQSIDTTMGFTPLDGLMMGTRSGSVDPSILIYLMRQGYSADKLDNMLNEQSGLEGISGISQDMRGISKAVNQNNNRAKLARDLYIHRFKACFGAMLMSLGGVDAIAFTAGIGEHSPWVRAAACEGMAFLGLTLNIEENENSPVDRDIATVASAVRVLVVKAREDWVIAQSCWHLIQERAHSIAE